MAMTLEQQETNRIDAVEVAIRAPGELEWDVRNDLFATQIVWSTAPNMPNATLIRFYGEGTVPGTQQLEPEAYPRFDFRGYFVRIRVFGDVALDAEPATDPAYVFYGIIENAADEYEGTLKEKLPSGVVVYAAYGLEYLLQKQIISTARTLDAFGITERQVETGLIFNEGGKPNRSPGQVALLTNYAFANDPDYDEASNSSVLAYWSPLEILRYLVANHVPKNGNNQNILSLVLDNATILTGGTRIISNDVRPVIDTDGRTLYDVLSDVLMQNGLSTWKLDVTEDVDGNLIGTIVSITLTRTPGLPVRAASSLTTLDFADSPLARLTINDTRTDRFDQLIVRGPKETFVFSCPLDLGSDSDTVDEAIRALARAWTPAQESAYSTAGNPTGNTDEKIRKAHDFRNRRELADVFSLYRIGKLWTGQVRTVLAQNTVNAIRTEAGLLYTPFRGAVRILPTLPFYTDAAKPLESPRRSIGIFTKRPSDPSKWISASQMQATLELGDLDDAESSRMTLEAAVENGRNLRIIVGGEPRHALAGETFTPQDYDREYPLYSYLDTWVTIAVETERYVERRYPATVDAAIKDDIRRKVINLGAREEFEKIYVATQTIKDVDASGNLVFETAGLIKNGAADNSAFDKIGKMLAEFYTVDRKQLSMWFNAQPGLGLGDFILTVGERFDDVPTADPAPTAIDINANTVVSEITVDLPLNRAGDQPQTPLWRITTTGPGNVDPAELVDSVLASADAAQRRAQRNVFVADPVIGAPAAQVARRS